MASPLEEESCMFVLWPVDYRRVVERIVVCWIVMGGGEEEEVKK